MPPSEIDRRAQQGTGASNARSEEPAGDTVVGGSARERFDSSRSRSLSDTAYQQTEAGQPFQAAAINLPPRFELRHSLGAGGMGEVVLAHDKVLGRDVAIKVLRAGDFGDKAMRDRLLNEAQAAAQIRHPHIVNIHDVDLDAGLIVMEYLSGGSGRTLLEKRGKLPLKELIPLARKLCAALGAAHAANLVHRDIKPDNVLFDARGEVKVADFGVAQFRRRTTSGGSEIVGTPAYMAPEQLRGADPDPRADIYALGLTLYELAAGRRFHNPQGPSDHSVAGLTNAAGNRGLARILSRCLAEDPTARWPSVGDLEHALARLERRKQRIRFAFLGVLLSVVIAVPLAFGLLRETETTVTLLKVAVLPFQNRTTEPRFAWLSQGFANLLHSALKRRQIPIVSREKLRDRAGSAATLDAWADAARAENASDLLEGAFEREGTELLVTATLRGRVYQARGTPSRADAIADELAASIAKELVGTPTKPQTKGRSPEAVQRFEMGYAALQQHEFQRAVELLREAIRLDPDFVDARYALITAMSSVGATRANLVSEANDALARPLTQRQRALFEALRLRVMRRYKSAAARYDQLVSRYPKEKEALYGLADSLFHLGRGDRAMYLFKRLVKLAPSFHLAYKHPVDWLGTRGRAKELAGYLYQLRRASPPGDFLGLMQMRLEMARRDYDRAMLSGRRVNPPRADLLAEMAGVSAILGRLENARELFAQASALSPENWRLRIARAALDTTEGRFVEFHNDIAWDTENAGPVAAIANRLATRGLLYALVGRMEEAQQDLVAVRSVASSQLQRRVPRLMFLEGLVGWAAEDVKGLKALYARIAKTKVDRAGRPAEVVPFLAGAILAASGKAAQAVKKFREGFAKREGPSYAPVFQMVIARSALSAGDLKTTADACEHIIRPHAYSYFRAAAVPPCLGILALVYDAQKRPDEARRRALKLLQLFRTASAEIPELRYARQVLNAPRHPPPDQDR